MAHSYRNLAASVSRLQDRTKSVNNPAAAGHSYRTLSRTIAALTDQPRPVLRLVPQPLAPRPNPSDAPRFETDPVEAKRVARILASLFALAAMNEPISQATRDKLGITTEDISAIADKVGKARAAEIMGLRWDGEDLVPDPNADKAITRTTENQVNDAVDTAVTAALAPGDTWAPGEGPNDTPAADTGLSDDEELALAIAALFAFSSLRPDVVADYETASMQNTMALTAYAAAGVTEVLVLDGEEFDEECLAGETVVAATDLEVASARVIKGEIVDLRTATGELLACTPNHPVLTGHGWVPAGKLTEGDEIIRCLDTDGLLAVARHGAPNDDYMPAMIKQVMKFALESPEWLTMRKTDTAAHLNGDGRECEVDAVRAYRILRDRGETARLKKNLQPTLIACLEGAAASLTAECAGDEMLLAANGATDGGMRRGGISLASLWRESSVSETLRLATASDREAIAAIDSQDSPNAASKIAPNGPSGFAGEVAIVTGNDGGRGCAPQGHPGSCDRNTSSTKLGSDTVARSAENIRNLTQRFTGLIEPTRLIEIKRRVFHGPVFNLRTFSGWYVAGGIVLHNCAMANGQTWTIEQAMANPLQHVRCQRSFLPLGADGMQLAAKRSRRITPLSFTPTPQEGS